MSEQREKRILVIGQMQSMVEAAVERLDGLGFEATGTINAKAATVEFDANDFDLIALGRALAGAPAEKLKKEFLSENPNVQFVDGFGPFAVNQIVTALDGHDPFLVDIKFEKTVSTWKFSGRAMRLCHLQIHFASKDGDTLNGRVVKNMELGVGPFKFELKPEPWATAYSLMFLVNQGEEHVHIPLNTEI